MKAILLISALTMFNLSVPAWAADETKPHDMSSMSMSAEDREKMATAHQNMATCLRSDQAFKICHDALKSECQTMMGGSCSAMDMEKSMRKGMKIKK